MKRALRVLLIDDSEDDALLLLRELERTYEITHRLVSTAKGLHEALADTWDIVISDWAMPGLDGLGAFRIVCELAIDIPFIIVSGTIGEEVAVEALKAGVHDFMTKGRWARLTPTIDRELREASIRRRQRESDAELVRQQARIACSERLHRLMFDNSPLPMWTFDRESLRFLAVNDAAIRHYGYSREEFASMTIADIRPVEDRSALETAVRAAAGPSEPALWRHVTKEGAVITVEVSANDLMLDDGPARLVLVHDVTERERAKRALSDAEAQLRQAQKMDALGRLAGGVAHDFNNVLTVMISYASMLEDALEPGDARREDAAELRRAAERATAITRQLLALSHHSIIEPRSVDLDDIVSGFSTMLHRLLGPRIVLATPRASLPPVIADPGQIEQVLMNLAVNARDAMPEGGRLTIETRVVELDEDGARLRGLRAGAYVEIAVTDTGIGMSAETQRRIFEPFFTTKEVGKGTGLGLSIVHGIVTQAGGGVSVYSELGEGTTFRVHLPVAIGTVLSTPREPVFVPRTLPVTVLVVDDQHDIRVVTARIIEEAGGRAIEAASAEEARRICAGHDGPIDVAIIDVVLPDARGDTLVPQLQALRPSIKAVLVSGYPSGALTAGGRAPADLLPKPFTPFDLRAAIARALGMQDPAVSRSEERAPTASDRQPRILLADDDEPLRRIISKVLRKAGFEVVEVGSGHNALAELQTALVDVVLTDVHMPNGTGVELVRAIRALDQDIPVILMSGRPDVETATTAVEFGAFRYLMKPIDSETLTKTVRHASRAHALARLRREAHAVMGKGSVVGERAGLEVRFDHAIDRLWMAFQPIVDAKSGALFGVEALLRSHEPSMPTPSTLIDAAMQLGRQPQLGRRVRALSAEAFAARADGLALFVNLHPDDLADIELVDELAPLSRMATRVVLEITERASLAARSDLPSRLARLRELGFRIAIDDIGAGYSGLTSFADVAPEIVKIDMSLVRDVHVSAVKQRTIAALCGLCHEFGALVVGEGVEVAEEREMLISLGCDLLQGYFLGRPERMLPAAIDPKIQRPRELRDELQGLVVEQA